MIAAEAVVDLGRGEGGELVSGTGAGVRRLVSVDELRRAWQAIDAGQFRAGSSPSSGVGSEVVGPVEGWVPAAGERVIAVVGCAGSVGASTVALAIGTVWPGSARVVECCPAGVSGLAAAPTAELGRHRSGWLVGRREGLVIDRVADGRVEAPQVSRRILVSWKDAVHAEEDRSDGQGAVHQAGVGASA